MNVDKTEIVRAENVLKPSFFAIGSFNGIKKSVLAMSNHEGCVHFNFYSN